MYFNFRVISKIGLALVVIGFLMPMVSIQLTGLAALANLLLPSQMNGLQLAGILVEFGEVALGILIYTLFAFALGGTVIGVLLLAKINVPPFIDCIVTFVCIAGSLYFVASPQEGIIFHAGISVMLVGSTIALFTQLLWSLSYLDPTDYKLQFSLVEFDTKLQRTKDPIDAS